MAKDFITEGPGKLNISFESEDPAKCIKKEVFNF